MGEHIKNSIEHTMRLTERSADIGRQNQISHPYIIPLSNQYLCEGVIKVVTDTEVKHFVEESLRKCARLHHLDYNDLVKKVNNMSTLSYFDELETEDRKFVVAARLIMKQHNFVHREHLY